MKGTAARHVTRLNVHLGGRAVDILALGQDQKIWFAYDPQWIATGFNLAPRTMAFDLTFSTGMGMGSEHTTTINGQGHPALEHVLHIGRKHRISQASQIVAQVRHAVAQWPALAQNWQVAAASGQPIEAALAKIDQGFKSAST